ncbi:hypothetical protein CH352_01940 [Leptospira hartskeerlii]|uniref:Uncharacterized protein n=1 Tax=Leptospira hartskeerlii TaxID=2023177 RepID=A0A2M9XDJ5_9LEPT|nr:hypothetical protein CH357_09035 [Leptospira hartskeerlii]PJZ35406.1 hypothetical protein CH352_01940 [Leptospira hartskeerlii]
MRTQILEKDLPALLWVGAGTVVHKTLSIKRIALISSLNSYDLDPSVTDSFAVVFSLPMVAAKGGRYGGTQPHTHSPPLPQFPTKINRFFVPTNHVGIPT